MNQTSPSRSQLAKPLLENAALILAATRLEPRWAIELPVRCPPVLWFGNVDSDKPRLLTVAANPSRYEYLHSDGDAAIAYTLATGDHSKLRYRVGQDNRLLLLEPGHQITEICKSSLLQNRIISGFNEYFTRKPYHWFGTKQEPSSNVEALLRGLGASYFDGVQQPMQAVHVDLFPFATLSDFKAITSLVEGDLFKSGWAQRLLHSLVDLIDPAALLIFGRNNYDVFRKHVDSSVPELPKGRAFRVAMSPRFGRRVIGISTNLGDPRGFFSTDLRTYGAEVRIELLRSIAIEGR